MAVELENLVTARRIEDKVDRVLVITRVYLQMKSHELERQVNPSISLISNLLISRTFSSPVQEETVPS